MSLILAENFTDFGLDENTNATCTVGNAATFASIIPAETFPMALTGGLSSGSMVYRKARDDGSSIDQHHPDDYWVGFVRGTWDSSSSYNTQVKVPSLGIFTKDGTWCLSVRAVVGEAGAAKETLFGVWVGDGITPILTINGLGVVYVGTTKVGTYLLTQKNQRLPMGIDILIESSGSNATASVFVNNINLGTVSLKAPTTGGYVSFGWKVSGSVSQGAGKSMMFFRDVVVTYDDGQGFCGRSGSSFHVQKMLPVEDVDAQWAGEGAHFSLMSRRYPVRDGDPFLSAYMFGQKEEYTMQSADESRGRLVLGAGIELEAKNTGTTTVPFENTYRGITDSIVNVSGGSDVPHLIPMNINPETGLAWSLSDLVGYTAGFGIEARK